MIYKIIIIVICLILSAMFSGSEIVYSSVNELKLENDVKRNKKGAKKALYLHKNFANTITTILIGNNLVNILLSAVAASQAISLFGNTDKVSLLTTIVVTVVVLIFGEILPKTIFQCYNYSLSYFFIWFVELFKFIFFPFVFIFTKFSFFISKIFKNYKAEEVIDEEEDVGDRLSLMTDDLKDRGIIDSDDQKLIHSAIDITDVTAWQIMVPRVDVIAYDIDDGYDKIISDKNFFINSRVPLYKDTIDNIIGIVDTTKVLKYHLQHEKCDLNECLYEPLYVHKTMPIASVLKKLRQEHKHIAIVLDEWGGTYGILTIEDILEELFGEIWDETDEVENDYIKQSEDTYLVDGDMSLDDFFELIDFNDNDFETNYSTLAGLCIEILDKIPEVGDELDFAGNHFVIVSATERRVEKILVKKQIINNL